MKQGINYSLKVNINDDLDKVKSIDFVFVQGNTKLEFTYPSTMAVRSEGENVIYLLWSAEDTYKFNSGSHMKMDTRIHYVDTDYSPETPIIDLVMNPTLFEEGS